MQSTTCHRPLKRPVQILPGDLLFRTAPSRTPSDALPPPEPDGPPPLPAELCKIAVVGDRGAGKTSAVRRFVRREYCDPSARGGATSDAARGRSSDDSVARSAAAKSGGRRSRAGAGLTLEYHKKDVALRGVGNLGGGDEDDDGGEDDIGITPPGSFLNERRPDDFTCVRVQVWDVTREEDDEGVHEDGRRRGGDDDLDRLLRSAAGVVIVCTLSERGGGVEGIRRTVSAWMDRVRAAVKDGVEEIDPRLVRRKSGIHSVLLVNKSDAISSSTASSASCAAQWMTAGSEIERICDAYGIGKWLLGTCSIQSIDRHVEEANVEHAFLSIVQKVLTDRKEQEAIGILRAKDDGVPCLISPDSSYSESPSSID